MTKDNNLNEGRVSRAFRAAGYTRTPRYWVKVEEAEQIRQMAQSHKPDLIKIHEATTGRRSKPHVPRDELPDWQRERNKDFDFYEGLNGY